MYVGLCSQPKINKTDTNKHGHVHFLNEQTRTENLGSISVHELMNTYISLTNEQSFGSFAAILLTRPTHFVNEILRILPVETETGFE
ncbi:hypothetical protein Hanom_Chr16g01442961 [Helianthus anomalus]